MNASLWANFLVDEISGRTVLRAMPVMLGVLGILAIAYRYYSAFLAARVAMLNDLRVTPAHTLNDGQNYHPTNKWVLFGHHFAAISGAGPLIGPVLAIQYGYMPGLLWLVIGVCLAGAVQDMLVMAASVRRGGRSLAEIAKAELGRSASVIASAAILVIVVIALAGLAFVVVKALGGEEAKLVPGMTVRTPEGERPEPVSSALPVYRFPQKCEVAYDAHSKPAVRPEAFDVGLAKDRAGLPSVEQSRAGLLGGPAATAITIEPASGIYVLPAGSKQLIPGSSWGTFTIACTIPIALFVGLW